MGQQRRSIPLREPNHICPIRTRSSHAACRAGAPQAAGTGLDEWAKRRARPGGGNQAHPATWIWSILGRMTGELRHFITPPLPIPRILNIGLFMAASFIVSLSRRHRFSRTACTLQGSRGGACGWIDQRWATPPYDARPDGTRRVELRHFLYRPQSRCSGSPAASIGARRPTCRRIGAVAHVARVTSWCPSSSRRLPAESRRQSGPHQRVRSCMPSCESGLPFPSLA